MKSGQGTHMYSRRGKSTINEYLCFQEDPEEALKRRHEIRLKLLFGYDKAGEDKKNKKPLDEDMEMKQYEQMVLQTGDYAPKEAIPQWKMDMIEMEKQREHLQRDALRASQQQFRKNGAENEETGIKEEGDVVQEMGGQTVKKKKQWVEDIGTSSFKVERRSKHSYINSLPQDTPGSMRYRPNYRVALPSNNFIYSIAAENSSGVQPRKSVTITKPCMDENIDSCTLEKRKEDRVKTGKYLLKGKYPYQQNDSSEEESNRLDEVSPPGTIDQGQSFQITPNSVSNQKPEKQQGEPYQRYEHPRKNVQMDKQVAAEYHKNPFVLQHGIPKHAPHESRFERLNDPDDMHKKQHQVPGFGNYGERKTLLAAMKITYYSLGGQPNPSYSQVHTKTDFLSQLEFQNQVARDQVYQQKMHERFHAMPKINIDPGKSKDLTRLQRPNTPLVDLDRSLPRDNLLYNISTHMNLKEVERYVRKHEGKHAVFGSSQPQTPALRPKSEIAKNKHQQLRVTTIPEESPFDDGEMVVMQHHRPQSSLIVNNNNAVQMFDESKLAGSSQLPPQQTLNANSTVSIHHQMHEIRVKAVKKQRPQSQTPKVQASRVKKEEGRRNVSYYDFRPPQSSCGNYSSTQMTSNHHPSKLSEIDKLFAHQAKECFEPLQYEMDFSKHYQQPSVKKQSQSLPNSARKKKKQQHRPQSVMTN